MNLTRSIAVVVLGAAAAIGSYVATQAWQPPSARQPSADTQSCATMSCDSTTCYRALAGWLGLSPEQTKRLEGIDPKYFADSAGLEQSLFAERARLADLFDDPEAEQDAILKQVDRVIAANGALERRVAAHLVALRSQLTSEQRQRLYERCAKGIREACGCGRQQRWRCGKSGVGVTTFEALCSQPCEFKPDGREKSPASRPAERGGHRHGRGGE